MTNLAERRNLAERYSRLGHAYVQLADKFQKLDVEHMALKSKAVMLLKAFKAYKQNLEQLQQEKVDLENKLATATSKHEQEKVDLEKKLTTATSKHEQEKADLENKLTTASSKYEELKVFEFLLQPEVQAALSEAEEQISLIDTTLEEIESDSDPDLNEAEKLLLEEYYCNPSALELPNAF